MVYSSIRTWICFIGHNRTIQHFSYRSYSYRFPGHGRCPIGACNKTSQTNAVSGSIPIDRSFRKPYVTCNVKPGLINHGLLYN